MIQAFSHIFNFFNIVSPCGDMLHERSMNAFERSVRVINRSMSVFDRL
jgi:hypothetical protein